MSNTAKFMDFCKGPLDNKPISGVPGVGMVLNKKLKHLGYHTARDLYELLKSLDFSESKFYLWLKTNCNGGHVQTVFKALKKWHTQFGHLETRINDSEDDDDEDNDFQPPTSDRITRRNVQQPTPRPRLVRRPNKNGAASSSGTGLLQSSPWGTDATSSFFYSMSETVKKFPRVLQLQIKSQVFEIVNNADAQQALDEETRAPASQCRITRTHSQDPRLYLHGNGA